MTRLESEPFQAPELDPLGALTGAAEVARVSTMARIDLRAVERLAEEWATEPWPEKAGLDALHFMDGTERTVNWILLLDALNFCFWAEQGQPRWRVEWRGRALDGYAALAASLTRAIEEGTPLWDARFLSTMTEDALAHILRPIAGDPPIPLFEARLANAREVGTVLLARYDGEFSQACERAGGSAVAIALILAREFSSFDDVAEWRGRRIPFLKRAQICVSDLHAAFEGTRWGAFHDLDRLTAFADYKLPQLLRALGVLKYADTLAESVDSYRVIPPGSLEEMEIRAATIWAVELLRRALRERGVERTASAIDYRLWDASQRLTATVKPYHRTRTIFY